LVISQHPANVALDVIDCDRYARTLLVVIVWELWVERIWLILAICAHDGFCVIDNAESIPCLNFETGKEYFRRFLREDSSRLGWR